MGLWLPSPALFASTSVPCWPRPHSLGVSGFVCGGVRVCLASRSLSTLYAPGSSDSWWWWLLAPGQLLLVVSAYFSCPSSLVFVFVGDGFVGCRGACVPCSAGPCLLLSSQAHFSRVTSTSLTWDAEARPVQLGWGPFSPGPFGSQPLGC